MLKHKHIDKIGCAVVVLTLVVTILFMQGDALGIARANRVMGYESRLFDTSRVHTLDIVMDDWDAFLSTCTGEEYQPCTVVIDGEAYSHVGIRGKGNTSLTHVASYGNGRYSFKIEFDKYMDGASYHGLDKLCLNNIIQDSTYLKDYLSYTMMNDAGIAAPLCSFVYITVGGEDWGLYLAVEGVEEGFLRRNYGANYGELYKPDSLSMGGGRGNGRDFFMDDLLNLPESEGSDSVAGQMPPEGSPFGESEEMPEGFEPPALGSGAAPNMPRGGPAGGGGAGRGNVGGGMGSQDVMLQYIDDDPESYPNIFGSAKTNVTKSDQARLIASLKTLGEGTDIASAVDVEAVIKYLAVHHFVVNGDSYTGSMVHNYYLHEKDGVLSMIPWDYNLAFGGFGMGGGFTLDASASGATSQVNAPIDSPVSGGTLASRPMVSWIFESEEYTSLYHQYYGEFLGAYFDSGYFEQMYDEVVGLISPYVEKDPTAFCTYEEFIAGTKTLREFCLLRAQSIAGQLKGTIPSTDEGQKLDDASLVDASHLALSDMGQMQNGNRGAGNMPGGDNDRTRFRQGGTRNETSPIPGEENTARISDDGGNDASDVPADVR